MGAIAIIDKWGRKIDYLRISVTDRCNLRCRYCMPKEGMQFMPEDKLLTFDEMLRVAEISAEMGVSKIRITGGEPLVRRGIDVFIKQLKSLTGIKEVYLTTNGMFLEEYMDSLTAAGLNGVNVSLDTLDENKFRDITVNGDLKKVLKGIDLSIANGLKVKLNTVVIKGFNDGEIMDFVRLTEEKRLDARFIELMPIGQGKKFNSFTNDDVKNLILVNRKLVDCSKDNPHEGPAVYYKTEKGIGRIGFISAVSHSFCGDCNRIRLTSEGFFKQCLFLKGGTDVKKLMREGISNEDLKAIMEETIFNKPQDHEQDKDISACDSRFMNEIGG